MCKLFIKLSECPAKDAKCEELDFCLKTWIGGVFHAALRGNGVVASHEARQVLGASFTVLFALARMGWK